MDLLKSALEQQSLGNTKAASSLALAVVATTTEERIQKISLLFNTGNLQAASAELTEDVTATFYGQLLSGKLQFKQGNFSAASIHFQRANEMLVTIPQEDGEREDCVR